MRTIAFPFFALVLALMPMTTGCDSPTPASWTPEKRAEVAKQTGEAAALIYLAIDKPEIEKAAAIRVVIEKVSEHLANYQGEGFIGAMPGIQEGIDKIFPNPEDNIKKIAATKLAKVLLEELDKMFEKHPDWKKLGNESAQLVGTFLEGASSGFEVYRTRKL